MFRQLVLARIIEPVSKLDSVRVLEEAGIAAVSYATLRRRLPAYAKEPWRRKLSAACAAHARLGPASLLPDEGGGGEKQSGLLTALGPGSHDRLVQRGQGDVDSPAASIELDIAETVNAALGGVLGVKVVVA